MVSNLLTLKEEYKNVITQFPDWSDQKYADYFGVTVSGFRSNLYRFGIRERKSKEIILGKPEVELREFAKDHTLKEIAEYCGKQVQNTWSALIVNNVDFQKVYKAGAEKNQKTKHYGDEKDMILELIKLNKFTDASIARVFGYSKTAIRKMRINHDN